jgi:hypothetical protein
MSRSAKSQSVVDLPIGARGGLRHHSGMAKSSAHLHRPWRSILPEHAMARMRGPFLRCHPTLSCLTETTAVRPVSLIDTLT